MNLTVAVKIIGGFAIISILLVVISIISLSNLDTISEATQQQNTLAIPTLKASNKLALELSQMSNLTLKGYYQTDLNLLAQQLRDYKKINSLFSKELSELKQIVATEQNLLANLGQVDKLSANFHSAGLGLFSSHKISIEQQQQLIEKIDTLEEQADDTVMLLLDLADHELADTKLQRAISLSEHLENQFNSIVSSSFEYRDILDASTAKLIESELSRSLSEANKSVDDIISELDTHNIGDISQQVSLAFKEIQALLSQEDGILAHKTAQLAANKKAARMLKQEELSAKQVNSALEKQIELANQTTIKASQLIEDAVSSGNTQTTVIMLISIVVALFIARATLIGITRPLARVNEMLNIVASGDLSMKLDESGTDEFAQLSRNCNLLIDSLRNLIESIVNRSAQLAAAAEQTSAVTAQSTTAIEEQRN